MTQSIFYNNGYKYVNRMKNQRKKAYGQEYMAYLLGKRNEPDYKDYNLSYMGAQAVRIGLMNIQKEIKE